MSCSKASGKAPATSFVCLWKSLNSLVFSKSLNWAKAKMMIPKAMKIQELVTKDILRFDQSVNNKTPIAKQTNRPASTMAMMLGTSAAR